MIHHSNLDLISCTRTKVCKEALITQFRVCYVTIWEQWCGRRLHGANVGYCTEVELLFYAIWGSLSKTGRRRQREEPGKDRFRISDALATLLIFILAQISSVFAKVLLLRCLWLRKSDCGNFSKWCSRPVNNLKVKYLKSHVRHDDPEIMSISHIHVPLLSSAISLIVSRRCRRDLPPWCSSSLDVTSDQVYSNGAAGMFLRCCSS